MTRVAAAFLVLGAALITGALVQRPVPVAATTPTWTQVATPNLGRHDDDLSDVAATSSSNA